MFSQRRDSILLDSVEGVSSISTLSSFGLNVRVLNLKSLSNRGCYSRVKAAGEKMADQSRVLPSFTHSHPKNVLHSTHFFSVFKLLSLIFLLVLIFLM